MSDFSQIARLKMLDLYKNHAHEIGRKSPLRSPKSDLISTDCIIYVVNVLTHAFNQLGDSQAAKEVKKRINKGTELIRYLVSTHSWKAVYYNPDVNHPRDALYYHIVYYKKVLSRCTYEEIPISYLLINYRPTAPMNHYYKNYGSKGMSIVKTRGSDLDKLTLESIKNVKFAFGLSRGGDHTWLYSYGHVYQVHWKESDAGLYEKTELRDFPWLDGVIVVPPDNEVMLLMGAQCNVPKP